MASPAHDPTPDLDQLIERYRTGDASAAAELIFRFVRYLEKWNRLLLEGRFARKDQEIQHFLRMTIGGIDPITAAQVLVRQLKAYEPADVKHEIQVVFLQTALKYGNVASHFRYLLKGRIHELVSDPIVFNYDRQLELPERLGNTFQPFGTIDEEWVQGKTCGKGFVELTERQRRIIQHTFWYGYDQKRTAQILNIPLRTVEREISRIRDVLKVHYHLK